MRISTTTASKIRFTKKDYCRIAQDVKLSAELQCKRCRARRKMLCTRCLFLQVRQTHTHTMLVVGYSAYGKKYPAIQNAWSNCVLFFSFYTLLCKWCFWKIG